ncbi:serine hydrolase domain-containing protein [Permianibacter aggregans]|uniref:CubicO group peptidase (Beta-lactamase class C family) n=1 Tax=Permianibacter aggregans TaxID=1510150 RepID=A0A4R6UUW5_9GAMM|nr:serine hydrolase [Permianibacter aggregans]QGX39547.1 class C beta-lactamase-related serine hydrolase [Permianibacter aggregans]TDQ49709.1 CubicO group peptidase (beta-lactamase class C family) [Permianibacter aggregans]
MTPRIFFLLGSLCWLTLAHAAEPYYPSAGDWPLRSAAELGLDSKRLQQAISEVQQQESRAPRDQALAQKLSFGAREPFDDIIGPMQERSGINGLVIYRGYKVAEFGDTRRTDMAHSISKSFLSAVVGLAWQQGLIASVDDPVRTYLPSDSLLFADPHNQPITWQHLLQQTSDWRGELWGKPDWADRPVGQPKDWANPPRHTPGSHYEYNDVRVNLLALAALQVWRQPLPSVLREQIMLPIGASTSWRWYGYDNSWVELDGEKMQSVSGGGHWGGGMFINAEDMARFGYLYLRNGRWRERQLISEQWIAQSRTPSPANAEYGYMNWFLNTSQKTLPSTPASSVTFRGNGMNIIYIDWQNELVVVVRWIANDQVLDRFLGQIIEALPE